MRKKILRFTNNSFVRNVFILASGTALAQIINMIFTPFITRIYGPESYGVMGAFTSIIQIFIPVSAFSYPIAIVLPKKENEAKNISKLSFMITLINTLLMFLLIALFSEQIGNILNIKSIEQFLYLIPLAILSGGMLQIIQQWMVRQNKFLIAANANIVETTIANIAKLAIGNYLPIDSVLVLITSLRQILRAFLMYLFSGIKISKLKLSLNKNERQDIFKTAKKYKDFPLFRTPEIVLSTISNSTPVLLLTIFFGPVAAGFYSIAKTVLGVPATLIATSVGDVFYPRVSSAAYNKQKIKPLIIKSTLYLSLLAIIPYGIIILFGPWLFSLVFGLEWRVAGEYARWMTFWSFFNFINKPSVNSLPVISAQRFHLIFTICKLIITTLGLFIGFYVFQSDIVAIALYSILGAISYAFLIIITIFKSNRFDEINSKK